jgi:NAD(P)H dehydrogenase (quinone)
MAEIIVFQFPNFTAMPAIMKGWIDRVLAHGFGFNPVTNSVYETGLFKGKSAMLVMTAGSPIEMYSEGGGHGDLNKHLEYITHCVFEFMGMRVLPSYVIYEASSMTRERGAEELEKYRKRLLEL